MSSESQPPSPSEQHELETLRVLLNLPKDVLDHFEPTRPPKAIERYVKRAPRREMQWLLVDVLHRLRTITRDAHRTRTADPIHRNGNGRGQA